MSNNLNKLIAEARLAYINAEVAFQSANINDVETLQPKVEEAQELVEKLEARQLKDGIVITAADVAKMKELREQINDAATLQQGLTKLISILVTFV
ncbi:hypothetical protein ACQ0MK_19920 [Thalassospira lucentensis]|uniref:hypothetical protein n=1 Tax=Thalassospira lucentensis TaxID=168935 RepID=UPI003D2EDB59